MTEKITGLKALSVPKGLTQEVLYRHVVLKSKKQNIMNVKKNI